MIYGVDLSAFKAGWCFIDNDRGEIVDWGGLSVVPGTGKLFRSNEVVNELAGHLSFSTDLVVMEDVLYARPQFVGYDIGKSAGMFVREVFNKKVPLLLIAPVKLKVFATGKIKASKEEVAVGLGLNISELKNWFGANWSDVSDAYGLAKMGYVALVTPEDRMGSQFKKIFYGRPSGVLIRNDFLLIKDGLDGFIRLQRHFIEGTSRQI